MAAARKKTAAADPLENWAALNERLRVAGEDECRRLLEEEKTGKKRAAFVRRIFHRYNKCRSLRERAELSK